MDSTYNLDDYTLNSTYTYTNSADATAVAAAGIAIFLVAMGIALVVYIVHAIFLGMVFKKAGVAGWKAWVPVLNNWKMLEIGGQKGFWAILALVPIVNIVSLVFTIIATHNINLKLRFDVGMTVVAILFTTVWLVIVALSKNTWNEALGAPRLDQPDFQPANEPATQQPTTTPPQPPVTPQQ